MTSYQKLKKEIASLEKKVRDLENAIADNDKVVLSSVSCRVKSNRSVGKLVWSGIQVDLATDF